MTDPRSPDRAANAARVASDEQHFVRVLSDRIAEFSRTEKLKMDQLPSMRDGDQLFSPRLFDNPDLLPVSKFQNWVTGTFLYIDIRKPMLGQELLVRDLVDEMKFKPPSMDRARDHGMLSFWTSGIPSPGVAYDTCAIYLADAVKYLFNLDTPESWLALRELAREERIPLCSLQHLSWGHHFGLSRIVEHALTNYILLNMLVGKDLAHRGASFLHSSLPGYDVHVVGLSSFYDGCEQDTPDRIFFHRWRAGPDQGSLQLLNKHLKHLFQRLYMYDWMIEEAGGHVDWHREIFDALKSVTKGILNRRHENKCLYAVLQRYMI
jgi:hypothetical protein